MNEERRWPSSARGRNDVDIVDACGRTAQPGLSIDIEIQARSLVMLVPTQLFVHGDRILRFGNGKVVLIAPSRASKRDASTTNNLGFWCIMVALQTRTVSPRPPEMLSTLNRGKLPVPRRGYDDYCFSKHGCRDDRKREGRGDSGAP